MITKIEMITGIIDLYDQLEAERNKTVQIPTSEPEEKTTSRIESLVLDIGKETLTSQIINRWRSVEEITDEESGFKTTETYEHWINWAINKDEIPNEVSYKEVLSFLDKNIREIYEEKREEAINKVK